MIITDLTEGLERMGEFTDRLAGQLIDAGYGVQGRVCVQGWNSFIDDSEDRLDDELEMFGEVHMGDFLTNDILELFYDFCQENDLTF